jgi:hypothetical protein
LIFFLSSKVQSPTFWFPRSTWSTSQRIQSATGRRSCMRTLLDISSPTLFSLVVMESSLNWMKPSLAEKNKKTVQ